MVLADRTILAGGLADFTRRSHEFGMGITDFVLSQSPFLVFRNEVLTRESIIDLAAFATRGPAEGS